MHGDTSTQVWTALFIEHPLSSSKKIPRVLPKALSNMPFYIIFLLFSPPPNWSPVLSHKNLQKKLSNQ